MVWNAKVCFLTNNNPHLLLFLIFFMQNGVKLSLMMDEYENIWKMDKQTLSCFMFWRLRPRNWRGGGFKGRFQGEVSGGFFRESFQGEVSGGGLRRRSKGEDSGGGFRRRFQGEVPGGGLRGRSPGEVSGGDSRRKFQRKVSGAFIRGRFQGEVLFQYVKKLFVNKSESLISSIQSWI